MLMEDINVDNPKQEKTDKIIFSFKLTPYSFPKVEWFVLLKPIKKLICNILINII